MYKRTFIEMRINIDEFSIGSVFLVSTKIAGKS
jgi:hypothetical protein